MPRRYRRSSRPRTSRRLNDALWHWNDARKGAIRRGSSTFSWYSTKKRTTQKYSTKTGRRIRNGRR